MLTHQDEQHLLITTARLFEQQHHNTPPTWLMTKQRGAGSFIWPRSQGSQEEKSALFNIQKISKLWLKACLVQKGKILSIKIIQKEETPPEKIWIYGTGRYHSTNNSSATAIDITVTSAVNSSHTTSTAADSSDSSPHHTRKAGNIIIRTRKYRLFEKSANSFWKLKYIKLFLLFTGWWFCPN